MLYGLVQISPSYHNDGSVEWVIKIHYDNVVRGGKKKSVPNAGLGFFWYKREGKKAMTDEQAIAVLRDAMIKRHEEEIAHVQKSLEKLKLVKYD